MYFKVESPSYSLCQFQIVTSVSSENLFSEILDLSETPVIGEIPNENFIRVMWRFWFPFYFEKI
jgi:hypothetical protein